MDTNLIIQRQTTKMPHRISKPFTFLYPLSKKVIQDLKIRTIHAGNLEVHGYAYLHTDDQRLTVDIDYIYWNHVDVRDVIDILGDIAEIDEAALAHAQYLFPTVTNPAL